MRRRRSWSGSSIIRLCEALTHAHGRGVVHRDIKPENILLRKRYGAALLTDFGIMKMVGERAVTSFGSGPGAGTKGGGPGDVRYMAPEQLDPKVGPVTARTDVYQLGAVMYECLTGKLPHGLFEKPSRLNAAVGGGLDGVVKIAYSACRRQDRELATLQMTCIPGGPGLIADQPQLPAGHVLRNELMARGLQPGSVPLTKNSPRGEFLVGGSQRESQAGADNGVRRQEQAHRPGRLIG